MIVQVSGWVHLSSAPGPGSSVAVGAKVASWWAAPCLVVVVGIVVFFLYVERLATTVDKDRRERRRLAEANGWRYGSHQPFIARRWTESLGPAGVDAISAHALVAGELDGVPFLFFDVEGPDGTRRTCWAVFLPVAFPTVRIPPDGRGPSAFVDALLTARVRARLPHFVPLYLQGRDVFYLSPHRQFTTEAVDTLALLVSMVRDFPPDVARRFGRVPDTDIPTLTS